MRFKFYSDALAGEAKLSVDGTVPNAIHFSHWQGNQTPASVKADTSTEIALNLVAAPDRDQLTQGIELVTNNHFDTDGVLSVWSVLQGERALPLRDRLIAAAEAGDFSEFSSRDGARASIVIQGSDSPTDKSGSPLALQLAGEDFVSEERSYELVLPHVEDVISNTGKYESLWRNSWARIEVALDSFAGGCSRVQQVPGTQICLVMLAPDVFGPAGFDPALHAFPFTAISHYATGELFLITTPLADGWAYRIDYPYYSWAETIVRPPIRRGDLQDVIKQLNEVEGNSCATWVADPSELASAAKCIDESGGLTASRLTPDSVADSFRRVRSEPGAVATG